MDYPDKHSIIRSIKRGYIKPPPYLLSTVYITGDSIEVATPSVRPQNTSGLRKGREKHHVDNATGEVLDYVPYTSRADDIASFKSSYKEVRRIIESNFHGGNSELHVILTYGDGQAPSPSDLYQDFRAFWKRFRHHYPGCEYLVVFEPHHDGRWHAHMLVKQSSGEKLYVPGMHLENLWRHGFVHVNRIHNHVSLALYLANKWREHPERLAYYPAGFRLYRRSRGIVKPEPLKLSREEVEKLVDENGYQLSYGDCVDIEVVEEDGRRVCLNTITHEFYKKQEENYVK